ncbi:NAD(P)-dependent oxidoreductase [Streptomyces qaidamensis]|uniref:NAD(P)-dependent oxidoreductase n=1 Tax=Streptomyces qaidamensis TaxID=1783515 RepID=UPI00365DB10F
MAHTEIAQSEHPATTVLFIGLGNMGWPMAARLVEDGRTVIVADADADREQAFATEFGCTGLREQQSLGGVDAVVLMLPTSAIVREALLGEKSGVATRLPATSVVVDMSSSDPTDTLALGRDLATRGIRVVDAPVSGGVPRARQGTLAIMLGADDEAAAALAVDVVTPMSNRVFRTGALGTGHAMKALNNYVAAAAFAAAAEATIIGDHYKLSPEVVLEVLNASTGRSFMSETTLAQVVSGEYSTGFALGLLDKDVRIASQLADRAGASAPVCDEVSRRFAAATASQGFAADHSRAYLAWKAEDAG